MALKLLIFITSQANDVEIHRDLATQLVGSLASGAEVKFATSADKGGIANISNFNIIHIFGCWSHTANALGAKAYESRIPYIVTPLGYLQPWEMEHHKNTLLLRQQQKLIAHASAVQVCGKLEANTFARLDWNHRVCLIKNPILTSQTTVKETSENLMRLYRKVIDSNARLLIKKPEQKLIGQLLQLGTDSHAFDSKELTDGARGSLSKFTDEDWRRLFIYSYEEDITDKIKRSLNLLEVEFPSVDVESIDRFDDKRSYISGQLNNETLLSKNLLLRSKVKDVFSEYGKTEQGISLAFLNLHYELNRQSASLEHFIDLYSMLLFTDMDEDAVRDIIHNLKLDDFAGSMIAVMQSFLGLTEGFMPFKPRGGKKARRQMRNITKFGTYIDY